MKHDSPAPANTDVVMQLKFTREQWNEFVNDVNGRLSELRRPFSFTMWDSDKEDTSVRFIIGPVD